MTLTSDPLCPRHECGRLEGELAISTELFNSLQPEVKENIAYWLVGLKNPLSSIDNRGTLSPYKDPDDIDGLTDKAISLHRVGQYNSAFSAYGRVLAVQLQHGGHYEHLELHRTIGLIILLLFNQYPELGDTPDAKLNPHTCQRVAFTKLPLDDDEGCDLERLLALRAIADWKTCQLGVDHNRIRDAHVLYGQIFDLMGNTLGKDHIEVYRLLHLWGSSENRSTARHQDAKNAESHLATALEGFDYHLGRLDPETIDCARTLGNMYLAQEKYFFAQAFFELIHKEHLEVFGPAHTDDRTLLSVSSLASSYLAQDEWAKSGRVIWTIKEDGPSLRERSSRSRSEYSRALSTLVHWGAPIDFMWESKPLACLPVRHVRLEAVSPSAREAKKIWHHEFRSRNIIGVAIPPSKHKMNYQLEVVEEQYVDLIIPYVPYSYYLSSGHFIPGRPYGFTVEIIDEHEMSSDLPQRSFRFDLVERSARPAYSVVATSNHISMESRGNELPVLVPPAKVSTAASAFSLTDW
jgi:hypothetical protein